jgi:Flp pilus assembly protein TadG
MTEQGAQEPRTSPRAWLRKNLGPRGEVVAAAMAFLLIVAVVAVAFWIANYQQADMWQAKERTARSELADAERNQAMIEASVKRYQGEIATLKSKEDMLAELALGIEADKKALAEREAAVTATEQQVAANTINEGTWTVGVDVEPGTYRTKDPVSGTCYWAIFQSGTNKDNIVQNDIVKGGSPTVTISAGQDFETSRCGSWVKQ